MGGAKKNLTRLSERHHAAVRMRIEGTPNKDIAAEVGVSTSTLAAWWCDPLIKAEISSKLERIDQVFTEKMAMATTTAIDTLTSLLVKPSSQPDISDHLKHDIAMDLLDRMEGLTRIRERALPAGAGPGGVDVTVNTGGQYNTVVASMNDDDLLEFLAAASEQAAKKKAIEGNAVDAGK